MKRSKFIKGLQLGIPRPWTVSIWRHTHTYTISPLIPVSMERRYVKSIATADKKFRKKRKRKFRLSYPNCKSSGKSITSCQPTHNSKQELAIVFKFYCNIWQIKENLSPFRRKKNSSCIQVK